MWQVKLIYKGTAAYSEWIVEDPKSFLIWLIKFSAYITPPIEKLKWRKLYE